MTTDNAVVNVPLSKRVDIDAQLDRYKADHSAQVERDARESRKRHIALLAEATGLIEQVSDTRMAALGAPYGMGARKTRKEWHAIAKRVPETVIALMRKELAA